jgi:hypothetical protein
LRPRAPTGRQAANAGLSSIRLLARMFCAVYTCVAFQARGWAKQVAAGWALAPRWSTCERSASETRRNYATRRSTLPRKKGAVPVGSGNPRGSRTNAIQPNGQLRV